MNTKQDHINQLLEKYRLRTINDAERHELEKAALDDSFLFDALEGFAKYELRNAQDLSDKNNKGKNIFRLWPLMAAASLILIASLWLLNDKTKISSSNEPIAMDIAEKEAAVNPINSEINESSQNTAPVAGNVIPTNNDKAVKKDDEKKTKSPSTTDKEDQINVIEKSPETNAMPSQTNTDNDGIVQSEEKSRQNISISQIDGVNVSIVSKDAASPLAEKMKNKIEPSNNIIEQAAVYPNMGIENLQRMMNMKKEVPLAAFRDNFHSEVEVKFTVNIDGTLSDYKIQETVCNECGKEVIRLLKLSGKWSTLPKGLKKESSIKVKF